MTGFTRTKSRIDLRPHTGRLIIATALLHIGVGAAAYAGPLSDIFAAGFWNSITTTERDAAFWFMASGVFLLLLGGLAHWSQHQTGRLPASLGWGLIAFAAAGVIMMPFSGFWLVIPLGLLVITVARTP